MQNGNPKNIRFLADLIDPTIQFINRQPLSGTRILLDHLLQLCELNSRNITGYTNEEFTHTAIAAHVASGAADAGFGIQYAAHQFGLDFIPVVNEQYVLACKKSSIQLAAIQHLLKIIGGDDFAHKVAQLPGYQLDSPGTLLSARTFLNEHSL